MQTDANTFEHPAGATRDYIFDWTNLLREGETIDTVTSVVPDAPLTVPAYKKLDGTRVVAWVAGGEAGQTRRVRCTVRTNQHPDPQTDPATYFTDVLTLYLDIT